MKKKLLTLIILCLTMLLSAAYNVGDIVDDVQFKDNESNKSIYSLISEKKVVVLFWGYSPWGSCVAAAPTFQTIWEEYKDSGNVYFVSAYRWEDHSHFYSQDLIPLAGDYYNSYTPVFAVIGAGNTLKHIEHNPDIRTPLNKAISAFQNVDLFLENPIKDSTINFSSTIQFDLDTVFTSVSNNEISFEIQGNENTQILESNITDNILTITSGTTYGEVNFNVKATAGELTSYANFTITADNTSLQEVYSESFEDPDFLSGGWEITLIAEGYGIWERDSGIRIPGTRYTPDGKFIARFNSYDDECYAGNIARLETPSIDLSNYKNTKLRFLVEHSGYENSNGNDILQIEIKSGEEDWQEFGEEIFRFDGDSTSRWQEYSYDLQQFDQTSDLQIGFTGKSEGGSDIMIDHVRIMAESSSGIINNEAGDNTPTQISLKGNYPNPFNPTTSIVFELFNSATVSLKIYNIKGELIATPLTDKIEAGIHNVSFNGAGYESGVYYYTIESDNNSLTGKMVLVK